LLVNLIITMYSYTSQISTTTQVVQDITSDGLLTLIVVVGLVLAVAMLSVGVAFGWRKLTRYALGRKF